MSTYYYEEKNLKINFFAIILGIGASLTGFVFRSGIEYIDDSIYGEENSLLTQINNIPRFLEIIILILIPTIGGGIVGYGVWKVSIEAKGHGIPDVLKAMHVDNGKIRTRVPLAKFFLSMLTIGTGNSAGAEGPIAQIGAGLGSTFGQKAKLRKNEINILVATGASAGIAAVFNAPLGGALFGIEILLASISLRSVIPVIIGTATSITTNNLLLNEYSSIFQVPTYSVENPIEYLFIILLGVIIAFVGLFWQKSLEFGENKFDQMKIPFWIKTASGGFFVGILLILSTKDLRGSSYKLIQSALLAEKYRSTLDDEMLQLVFLFLFYVLIKILITTLTLGSGQSGGIFSPSLLMGAYTGVAYGVVLTLIFPTLNINPGLYAILGMAALFAGVARAPLTMIIIATEMSGEYNLFPALMLTVSVSFLIHNTKTKESIYTEPLDKFGISTRYRSTDDVLNYIPVSDVMSHQVVCIYYDTPVSNLIDIFISYHHIGYIVVNRNYNMLGIVTLTDLRKAQLQSGNDLVVSQIMSAPVISIYPNDSVKEALDLMYRNGIGRIAVILKNPHSIIEEFPVGIFTRSDIIKTLESTQRLIEIEHNKKLVEFKHKITEPILNTIPTKYPHLKNQVVIIQQDWIGAYLQVMNKNQENEAIEYNKNRKNESP